MRKRGKVDSTQADIVEVLRECGFSVLSLASLGKGAPDLLVARSGRNMLIECKSTPIGYKLTRDQKKFHERWNAHIFVLGSVEDAEDFAREPAPDTSAYVDTE